MRKTRVWVAVLAVLAMVLGQFSVAQAAPLQQAGTTTVTIVSVTPTYEADGTTVNGYDVTYSYEGGYTGSAHLTIQEAYDAGMLQDDGGTWATDADGNPILIVGPGDTLDFLTSIVGADPCAAPAEGGHPVGEALQAFFCGSQGVSYDDIMAWREGGFGFGVIGQALFMAQALNSTDPDLVMAILDAKHRDFASLDPYLETYCAANGCDAGSISNWGQLKKAVMMGEVKSMTNLGAIMSGRATPLVEPLTTTTTTTTSTAPTLGKGHGKGKANGHGKGKGH